MVSDKHLFYVGTCADESSPGIYICRLDLDKEELECTAKVTAGANPSFLALHPTIPCLYAVNELSTFNGKPGGAVSSFAIDPLKGNLTLLNQQPSHGEAPCHIAIDRSGRYALAANYSSGTLAVYPITKTGSLENASDTVQHSECGSKSDQQKWAHAHAVHLDLNNRFVLSCDLGLDKILIHLLDLENGRLLFHGEAMLHPGAGPRHLAFHPGGSYAYVINELDSTLTVFSYDADCGRLKEIQTVPTLPGGYTGANACAEIAVHPSGKFVYGSNRGYNSIVIYMLDEATGRLTLQGHESTQGQTPRNFVIDPTGNFLLVANQDSDSLIVFHIDPMTGNLSPRHKIDIPKPVCILFRHPLPENRNGGQRS